MAKIVLTERQQERLQHTLKRIATAYRLLVQECDELHDEIFVKNNKEEEDERSG